MVEHPPEILTSEDKSDHHQWKSVMIVAVVLQVVVNVVVAVVTLIVDDVV